MGGAEIYTRSVTFYDSLKFYEAPLSSLAFVRNFERLIRHLSKKGAVIETTITTISQPGSIGEKLAVIQLSLPAFTFVIRLVL
jgi:hypothetical protein